MVESFPREKMYLLTSDQHTINYTYIHYPDDIWLYDFSKYVKIPLTKHYRNFNLIYSLILFFSFVLYLPPNMSFITELLYLHKLTNCPFSNSKLKRNLQNICWQDIRMKILLIMIGMNSFSFHLRVNNQNL